MGSYLVCKTCLDAASSLVSLHVALAGSTLPARSLHADPYTADEIWGAVATVELALEVCASRFTCAVPLAVVAADFGNHHALVRGSPVPKTQCSSLRGDSSKSEPEIGWNCRTAGVAVSASPVTSAGDTMLLREVSVDAPPIGHAPIDSL